MPTPKKPDSPPSDLDAESKRLWKRTVGHLTEQDTWRESDVPALERYIRATERARHARGTLTDAGLTAEGSQGQLVQHPNVKTAREAERDAHAYAEALLLTPAARKRHEITGKKKGGRFGEAFD